MESGIVAGVIAGLTYKCLRLNLVAVVSQDAGTDCTSIRLHALQLYLQPVLADFQIVSQQRRWFIHIDNQHIHVAVVVEVAAVIPSPPCDSNSSNVPFPRLRNKTRGVL